MKDFFSKCDQIRMKLLIWSHLLNRSIQESFIFCAVQTELSMLLKNNFLSCRVHNTQIKPGKAGKKFLKNEKSKKIQKTQGNF